VVRGSLAARILCQVAIASFVVLALCPIGRATDPGWPSQSPLPARPPTTKPIPAPEDRVDINHAGLEALAKVPGMTESWAGRIIRFRPYRTKVDLLDRGVIPSDVYDRIKDYVIAHRDKQ
jgi:competence protein ComEA